jgi:hypothetical protein
MSKHTSGPWVISPASTESAEWDEIFSADMEMQIADMHECKTRYSRDMPHREEVEANARLIAASPEMYDLLQEIYLSDGMDAEDTLGKINNLINRINK